MNVIDEQDLKEIITNPKTRREELLCLALDESGDPMQELNEFLVDPFSEDFPLKDPENQEQLHQSIESAQSDLITTRKTLSQIAELLADKIKDVESEVDNGNLTDDLMTKNQQAFLLLGGLEEDDECLANSALTYAINTLGIYSKILDIVPC